MFKSCTLFLGKLFLKSPVVHHVSPKLINVYFENSKNKSPVILNLKNIATVKFVVSLRKGDNVADEYILIAVIDASNNIELGIFESKKEAEDALMLLNIKVSSLGKLFAKWLITIVLLLSLFMVGKDLLILWSLSQETLVGKNNVATISQPAINRIPETTSLPSPQSGVAPVQTIPEAPVLSEEELMKLFQEAQKLTQQNGSENLDLSVQPGTVERSQDLSPADMFIQGLK